MKHPKTILAILLIVMIGCDRNRQATDAFITVDVTANYPKKELVLQDFMDVEYIALQTCDKFFTQGLVRAVGKEIIVVTNKNLANDGYIYIFDRTGKGIRVINRRGQGPEEYTRVMNLTLDEDNGELYIVNFRAGRRVNVYDLYGNFKRSFSFDAGFRGLENDFNFDNESIITHNNISILPNREIDLTQPSYFIISKQDGSRVKDIHIPFEQRRCMHIVKEDNSNSGGATIFLRMPVFPIIPYHGSWILTDPSSDTVFRFFPDYSMTPFMVRTPSIESMRTEVFLFPTILTNRYYFMVTVPSEIDFEDRISHLVYDRQQKKIFRHTVLNSDYTIEKPVNMTKRSVNNEIAFWQIIEVHELVEAYENGHLRGRLKEVAAKLDIEDNPVIMLIKHKQKSKK